MMRGRPGFALVATVAVLAIAGVTVLGLFWLASGTVSAVRQSADAERARLGAESALRLSIAEWDQDSVGNHPAGTRMPVPGAGPIAGLAGTSVEFESLVRGLYLLRATAALPAAGAVRARAAAAATLTAIPTDELWRDFHSAAVAGGDVNVGSAAAIVGDSAAVLPPGRVPADCPGPSSGIPWIGAGPRPGLAFAATSAVSVAPGAVLTGGPPQIHGAARTQATDFDRLGPIDSIDFMTVADRTEAGTIRLAARAAGSACDTARAGNWGEPAIASHPCHDYMPLVHAPGDLVITGGAGQGILVIDGDLHLAAGVRFDGAILVRGRLDDAGASVFGSVRIAGRTGRSDIRGTIRFDECGLGRAFRLAPALRRVYRYSERWWIPGF